MSPYNFLRPHMFRSSRAVELVSLGSDINFPPRSPVQLMEDFVQHWLPCLHVSQSSPALSSDFAPVSICELGSRDLFPRRVLGRWKVWFQPTTRCASCKMDFTPAFPSMCFQKSAWCFLARDWPKLSNSQPKLGLPCLPFQQGEERVVSHNGQTQEGAGVGVCCL